MPASAAMRATRSSCAPRRCCRSSRPRRSSCLSSWTTSCAPAYATYGGANKPYFTVADGALVAHNNPVPRFTGSLRELGVLRRLFGFSHLAAFVARALDAEPQWVGGVYTAVDTDHVGVACKLLERLAARAPTQRPGCTSSAARRRPDRAVAPGAALRPAGCGLRPGARDPERRRVGPGCARSTGATPPRSMALYVIDPASGDFGHMSGQGNALMADILAS